MKLKYMLYHVDEREVTPELPLMSVSKFRGVIRRSEISDDEGRADDISNYKTCKPDDLVINRMAAYQGALGIANEFGAISPDYMVLRILRDFNPSYLGYFFKSHWMHSQMSSLVKGIGSIESTSTRTPRLSWTDLKELDINVPPLAEQESIASFLDRELAQIDALIANEYELITRLDERRTALIRYQVFGSSGQNPKRNSGIDWIGEIPEHWSLQRIKNAVKFSKGGVWGNDLGSEGASLWCVRVADFIRDEYRISAEGLTLRSFSDSELNGRILKSGDLLLEKSGGGEASPVGFVAIFDHQSQAVSSNFINLVRIRDSHFPKYWVYVFAALYSLGITKRSIKQTSGIQNLDQSMYFDEVVGFPPLEEQIKISQTLDTQLQVFANLKATAERGIDLLRERRQALISAAVTGKIDVRKVA